MSKPLWHEGDPIALGTDMEEQELDLFDRADAAYEMMMDK